MDTTACEIKRLPAELLASVISLAPPDACRAASVSRTFHDVADSDAVWSRFLPRQPRDLPELAEGELPRTLASKKALFRGLSEQPALLPCKLVSMWLDRATASSICRVLGKHHSMNLGTDFQPPNLLEFSSFLEATIEASRG